MALLGNMWNPSVLVIIDILLIFILYSDWILRIDLVHTCQYEQCQNVNFLDIIITLIRVSYLNFDDDIEEE